MSAWTYVKEVFLRVAIVGILSLSLPFLITYMEEDSFLRLVEVCAVSALGTVGTVLLFGMKSDERKLVSGFIKKKFIK